MKRFLRGDSDGSLVIEFVYTNGRTEEVGQGTSEVALIYLDIRYVVTMIPGERADAMLKLQFLERKRPPCCCDAYDDTFRVAYLVAVKTNMLHYGYHSRKSHTKK